MGSALLASALGGRPGASDRQTRPGHAWDSAGAGQWVAAALISCGWILATAVVAGITRGFSTAYHDQSNWLRRLKHKRCQAGEHCKTVVIRYGARPAALGRPPSSRFGRC